MRRNLGKLLLLTICLAPAGCEPPPPERVWVPGPGFQAELKVAADLREDGTARVGEWITLLAQRRTGPYVEVARTSLDPNVRWVVNPPDGLEKDVQGNVRWMVEPEGFATFNIPTAADIKRRAVRFSEPGSYTIHATSHVWGSDPVSSNAVKITIVP